jgi:DNA-binding MarR family transcriptional regulator
MSSTTVGGPDPAGTSDGLAADVGAALLEITGPLRRVLRRAVAEHPLTHSQAELLRAVQRQPGISVVEMAAVLQLAANSVSTLVNHLVASGLLDRRRDPDDRRRAHLWLTKEAERLLAGRRALRRHLMEECLAELDADDHRRIADALPALRRLVASLEARG